MTFGEHALKNPTGGGRDSGSAFRFSGARDSGRETTEENAA